MAKVNIANVASQLNNLKLERYIFVPGKTKGSDKLSTQIAETLELLTSMAILSLCHQIKITNQHIAYVTTDDEMHIHMEHLLTEWSQGLGDTEVNKIQTFIDKEKSFIKCSPTDYFRTSSRVVRDSNDRSHARALGLPNRTKPTSPNFVLKFKGFGSDSLQIRMGIRYELLYDHGNEAVPGADIFTHNGKVKVTIVDIVTKN